MTDAIPALCSIDVAYQAVLDAELVAAQGRAGDFYRVAPTVTAPSPGLTIAVFDVLWLNGESLLQETYDIRRARLADLELPTPIASLPSRPRTMAPHLFRACEEHGVPCASAGTVALGGTASRAASG
jgi:ATP-dependent DNA ligase